MAQTPEFRMRMNTELIKPLESEKFCLDNSINAPASARADAFIRALTASHLPLSPPSPQ